MKVGPKGWNVNYGKWPNYIVRLIGYAKGLNGVVELFITHRNELLIEYPFVHLFYV